MQVKINNYKIRLFIGHNIAILVMHNNFNRILFKLWAVCNRCDIPSSGIAY
jgi:hypothetical protein